MRRGAMARSAAVWVGVAGALVWTLFPFYWALLYSIKPTRIEYRTVFLPFLQFRPTLVHWRWEWTQRNDVEGLAAGLANSLVVALGTAAVCSAIGLLAATGLLRRRRSMARTGLLVGLFLLPKLLPPVAIAIPLVRLLNELRVGDSDLALILAHSMMALPLAILVFDSTLREMPADLLDAARLDGAGWLRVLLQIVTPLIKPVIFAVGVLCFAQSWNEFPVALTNHSRHAFTAPISVAFLQEQDGIEFTHVGSHIVLIVLPPLLLALAAQKHVVRGLTFGAVRGER